MSKKYAILQLWLPKTIFAPHCTATPPILADAEFHKETFEVWIAWIPGDQVFSGNDIFGFEGGCGGFRLLRIQWCYQFEPIPWELIDMYTRNNTIFHLSAWVKQICVGKMFWNHTHLP